MVFLLLVSSVVLLQGNKLCSYYNAPTLRYFAGTEKRLIETCSSPTQMLENEHIVIAQVVGTAPIMAARLQASQPVEVEMLQELVEFMCTLVRTLYKPGMCTVQEILTCPNSEISVVLQRTASYRFPRLFISP